MSRQTLFTDELGEEICERLANGESMVDISRDTAMPSLRTMVRWAAENEAFGVEYARAREAQAEHMDHKILEAAEDADADNAAAQRVKIDAYKWRAMKLNKRVYGDKMDLTSNEKALPALDEAAAVQKVVSLLEQAKLRRDAMNGDG